MIDMETIYSLLAVDMDGNETTEEFSERDYTNAVCRYGHASSKPENRYVALRRVDTDWTSNEEITTLFEKGEAL